MSDHEIIKNALNLKGDHKKIAEFYKHWADSYDDDVLSEKYKAPNKIAQLAITALTESHRQNINPESLRVLDAGCGTGLVAIAMHAHSFQNISGFDLSADMVAKAQQTGVYQQLYGNVDMNHDLYPQIEDRDFDITVCGGVYTLGHVLPESLHQLISITRPGGFVISSARKEYCDEHDFAPYCKQLADDGKIKILHAAMDAYVSNDQALYSIFEVL